MQAVARRTYIAAGVAADALGQFRAEVGESFFRAHCLDPSDLVETVSLCICGLLRSQHLFIKDLVILGLAEMTSLQHHIRKRHFLLVSVDGRNFGNVAFIHKIDPGDALDIAKSHLLELSVVQFALAADSDDVSLFPYNLVLLDELVEAEGVAGFQEDQCLSFHLRSTDHILGQVGSAESVIYKIFFELLSTGENVRFRIIDKVAFLPAEHTRHSSVSEEFFCTVYQFLHLISSNLTFLPRERIFSANSFIVAANLAPSDAETHSTLVLPFSTPR